MGNSRVGTNKTVNNVYNYGSTLNNNNTMISQGSLQRQKLNLSHSQAIAHHGSVSRVISWLIVYFLDFLLFKDYIISELL